MPKLFCSDGLSSAVKLAANAAGILVGANNKEVVSSILPVAEELLAKITGEDTDGTVINGLLKQAVVKLMSMYSDNKAFLAEAEIILPALGIDVSDSNIPTLSNKQVKELIEMFVAGLKAGAAA